MDAGSTKRERLREWDEWRLPGRLERAERTDVHSLVPGHFFSAASSECRDAFIDGHFYACISLTQAVAEGLSRFLGDIHKVGARKDPRGRVLRLRQRGVLSQAAAGAFTRIRGNDRDALHHMNPDVTTDHADLERRAEECVNGLFTIESELFAYVVVDGKLVPSRREYWPEARDDLIGVHLRSDGH